MKVQAASWAPGLHPSSHPCPPQLPKRGLGASHWGWLSIRAAWGRDHPPPAPSLWPPNIMKLFPWLTLKYNSVWEEKLEGEVQQQMERCGVKPRGNGWFCCKGIAVSKRAVAKFHSVGSVRTEVCFNCELKWTVPGFPGSGGSFGGAVRVRSGITPMTGLATGGQEKLVSSFCQDLAGHRRRQRLRPPQEMMKDAPSMSPGGLRVSPEAPLAALICKADFRPHTQCPDCQALNCLYGSQGSSQMTRLW